MPHADREMTKPASWSAAAAAPDRALPPGTRIDDYEIEQTLAEGGIGIVYRAFDHALGMQIALEEYMPEAMALRSTDGRVVLRTRVQGHAFEAGRQAFVGEAQTLARCEHSSLLRIDRIVQRNGTVYRAMRLCTGPTLLAHRRALGEAPDAATLQRWLEDLLGALAALHAEGCVHGALAPGRILLRDDGHLLLLGFDAVRAKLISGRTQDMMAAIEPSFAAPELRNPSPGQAPGPWTDLYALATTLRFCIDGELPPPATGLAAAQPARLPSQAWRRAPHAVAADAAWLRAVDACLAEAPQDRPQSVAELRHMIDEALFASTLSAWPAPRIDAAPSNDAEAMPQRDDGATLAPPEPVAPADSALEFAAPAAPAPGTPAAPAPAVAEAAAAPDAEPASARAPAAADAAIAHMLADLDQTLARVSAMAGAEAEAQQTAPAAASTPASVPPPATGQRPAPPSAPPAWQRELRSVWRRNPAAWLAAAVVAVLAVVLLFVRDDRPSADRVASDMPAAAPISAAPAPLSALPLPPAQPPSSMPAPAVATAALDSAAPEARAPEPAAAAEPATPVTRVATAKPPVVAAARPQPAPRAACAGKNGYALYQCMQTQCAKRSYAKHSQCVQLLKHQSLN
jgi:serine/threonine protein kinase